MLDTLILGPLNVGYLNFGTLKCWILKFWDPSILAPLPRMFFFSPFVFVKRIFQRGFQT